MKKKFYSIIIGLFSVATVNAQITITTPPTSIASQIDTFARPTNLTDFASYATPQNNGAWDFTIAQYPNIQFITLRSTTPSSNYPTSKFSNLISNIFAGGLQFSSRRHYDITSNSIEALGEEIETTQIIPIGSLTGNANDELVFPAQKILYSTPLLARQYPETLGKTFTSSKSKETDFNITLTAYSLNNTPGLRKTYITVKDSVIGWGTLKIKGISTKKIYDKIPVLQVRHEITQTDSFFLGGNPAPQPLLDAFGLNQGVPITTYYVDFIGQGELDEYVRIDFQNSQYQQVEKVEIQQNRLEKYELVGIEKISIQNAINSYPNPIRNNNLFVDLPTNQNGKWSFNIVDIYGRNISKGDINTTNGQVILPAEIADGSYVLTIMNDGVTVSVNKIFKQQ